MQGDVKAVTMIATSAGTYQIKGKLSNGQAFTTYAPNDPNITKRMTGSQRQYQRAARR